MITFALISEGVTDQVVLEKIIESIWPEPDEIEVNFLQPARDATDGSGKTFGGWELVLEHCRNNVKNAVESNDYVVIHIDTDTGEQRNFGLNLTDGGRSRGYEELITDVKKILIKNIGEDFYEIIKYKVVFAISVHSMESWVLLCLYNRDEPMNSFARLNRELTRRNEPPLSKNIRRYRALVREINARRLNEVARMSGSLPVFLAALRELYKDA